MDRPTTLPIRQLLRQTDTLYDIFGFRIPMHRHGKVGQQPDRAAFGMARLAMSSRERDARAT